MSTRNKFIYDVQELGVLIRTTRKKRHLSLKELGKSTAISHTQISRIERGQFVHASKNVQKICLFLKINAQREAQTDPGLESRLARLARRSPEWRKVMSALADALECAEAK